MSLHNRELVLFWDNTYIALAMMGCDNRYSEVPALKLTALVSRYHIISNS